MMRLLGLFALIPATLVLAISFFVLFTIRKIESQGLKVFGYVISALLWVAAALLFLTGVYTMSTGRHPMMPMVQQMMSGQRQWMRGAPMSEMMPAQKQK